MTKSLQSSIVITVVFALPLTSAAASSALKLWYDKPAEQWSEALPIGNGRLGAMVFGGVTNERVQFNESTLWTGQPHEYQHEGAVKFLPQMRQLLNEGRRLQIESRQLEKDGQKAEAAEKRKAARAKQKEAEDLGLQEFMSVPLRQKAYQPFGDIRLSFPDHAPVAGYRRELDLDTAVAKVSYRAGDVTFVRECFATFPDQAIV
jgi:alpha-L-fucosidase 2